MKKIRIIITDDHVLLRAGIKHTLEEDGTIDVVGEAGNGEELLSLLKKTPCDLITLDLNMPVMGGSEVIARIAKAFPVVKILVITVHNEYPFVKEIMSRGAHGYILKGDNDHEIRQAIKSLMEGNKYISPSISSTIADNFLRSVDEVESPPLDILSTREIEVLKLIGEGLASKEIGKKLFISSRTVETHRKNLSNKLNVHSIAGLVKYAILRGLL